MQTQPLQHSPNSTLAPSSAARILSTQEAADFLRVHPATITRMVARGQLRAARVGDLLRIREADLLALFEPKEEK